MDPTFMTYNSGPLWLLILIICWGFFKKITGVCSGDDEDDEGDQLVEGLADYYEALKKGDKASIIGQEETMLAQYQVKTFSDEQFGKLK